ncbi:MAG: hypothetical protein RLZZ385_1991 [Pseudomonadota bacterium]|jgi:ABC-2 type transport system ATP-binding protein
MNALTPQVPLAVRALGKRYGNVQVIRDLDLEVTPGAIHGLVGLNGSGKTTTLECILGLQSFNAGSISVLGYAPNELYRARGRIVGIFDTPSLHPNLTVRQSLQHARLLCEHPRRSYEEVEELLGIGRYRGFRIRHLSLGNRRRASIAQALLGNPEVILLDEPFNGLDAEGVEDVLRLITTLNREYGTAFLLSSHQLPYLEQVCSHLAVLHHGHIAINGAVEQLFARQQTRLLIRCEPLPQALALLHGAGHGGFALDPDGTSLSGELGSGTAAELNRLLVNGDIAVHELVQQRASLTSLFQQITSAPESH